MERTHIETTRVNKLEQILENYSDEEFLIIDGFDEAIIGVDTSSMRLIYSVESCLEILSREMDYLDAIEHFDHNIRCAYVGVNTPILCD